MAFHYQVLVSNLSDTLVAILQSEIADLSWNYQTIGGCGDCNLVLNKFFDKYGDINLDYDVQLWRVEDQFGSPGAQLPAEFTASGIQLGTSFTNTRQLRWSGFVREKSPTLQEFERVSLNCSGYQRQLQYVVVPMQSYINMDVSEIARIIIDTYVLPNTRIKRTLALNLCQNTGVIAQELHFDCTVYEALQTLADIGGNAEWGVRADREIFFTPRSTQVKQQWEIGDRVKYYQPMTTTDEIVTKVYLRGSNNFTATLVNASYGGTLQKERVIMLPAIRSSSDAVIWGLSYFAKFGSAQSKGSLKLGSSDAWIESITGQTMPPLGRLKVHGGMIFIPGGPTGSQFGASGIAFPIELGGYYSGVTDELFRVDSINYRPTENGLDIDINLGEKRGSLTDALKSIEFRIDQLRQGLTL